AQCCGMPRPDLARSFVGTNAELMRASIAGFNAARLEEDAGVDVGVLPRKPVPREQLSSQQEDVAQAAGEAWRAIRCANEPAQFFNRGGVAIWVKVSLYDQAVVEGLDLNRMRWLLGEVADYGYYGRNKKGEIA